ncbi:MAG: alkaline phosphatase D family protein [Thioalkalivibrionaceae bacterium]
MSFQRRRFLLATAAVPVAGSLLSACTTSDDTPRFDFGVASGDPLSDRVILWTHVTRGSDLTVDVNWEVATDAAFTNIVRRGVSQSRAERDYTVKVDADGLLSDRVYFYRFRVEDEVSPIGRTRTLPIATPERIRFAVVSCSNYPAGYFHVYRDIAERDDIDAVLHLGDYIYEYDRSGYASADAAALGRLSEPDAELVQLNQYRRRYRQYRSDSDLQAFHARHPMIAVWDDHEVANDSWRAGAENHDTATQGDFFVRRANAIKAWLEWLPVREQPQSDRIFRRFEFGGLVTLHMLDTRNLARDEQLDYADFISADGRFDAAGFQAALTDSSRTLLGLEQLSWLEVGLANSTARWQVLGQQVLIGRMNVPAPVFLGLASAILGLPADPANTISVEGYLALAQRAQIAPETLTPTERAILAQPAIPYNLDAWDGYPVERERLFQVARSLDHNLVVLAGDTHNAWASDLSTLDRSPIGVEFATASVSSPGLEALLPQNPALAQQAFVALIEPLRAANLGDRGYLITEFTADQAQAEWVFVSSVKERTYRRLEDATIRLRTRADTRRIEAS